MVGRRSVPPPPDPPRVLVLVAAVRVGLALLLAALVGWLFDVSAARTVTGVAVVGSMLSGLSGLRAHRRAQRRARARATTEEPRP